jgi:hypothetical protein
MILFFYPNSSDPLLDASFLFYIAYQELDTADLSPYNYRF